MQKVIERWSDFSSESEFSNVDSEDCSSDSSEDEIYRRTNMDKSERYFLYTGNYKYNNEYISLQSKN